MAISLMYYGIFNQDISINDSIPKTNYSDKEIETFLMELPDNSLPAFSLKPSYPISYFQNAIDSLAEDDNELDEALRKEITNNVEPIPSSSYTWDQVKYVGGDDVFSDLKNWHSSEQDLANYGNRILQTAKALANQTQIESFLNLKFMNAITDASKKLSDAITAWPYKANTFPWGANWYQFSVSIPYYLVCAYYILRNIYRWNPDGIKPVKDAAIVWCNKLDQDPQTSLGWKRTGPNTILIGSPWLVTQFWQGKLDQDLELDATKYMVDQANVKTVVSGEGMRPDGGYIFHTNVRAYGYVASSLKSAKILNCLAPNNFGYMYQYLSNLMSHPTIDANLAGLFSREPTVKRFMNPGQLGAFAQFSGGLLTYKQPDWFIQIMGCVKDVAYYEADKANDRWAPAWIMLREMWTRGSLIRQYDKNTLTQFPGYTRMESDVSGESPSFPTKTSTTTSMVPAQGDTAVIIDQEKSIMFTSWKIDVSENKNCYYTLLNGYRYREVTILDKKGRTTVVYFHKTDMDKESVIHTMELGVILKKQTNGVIRFTNGKNLYCFAGEVTEGKPTEISFRDGHTEKQTAFFAKPVKGTANVSDENKICYLAYSVWFDSDPADISFPYSSAYIVANYRGDTIVFNKNEFIVATINMDGGYLANISVIYPEKLDTNEVGCIVAPASKNDPKSVFTIFIARFHETLPLGIMPAYIPRKDRKTYYCLAYDDASDNLPGDNTTGYTFEIGAPDFKFQAEFRLFSWLNKIDYSKQNADVTKGNNAHGFFTPEEYLRETPEAKMYKGGLAWSWAGPNCKEEITRDTYQTLRKKYGYDHDKSEWDNWDPWKF